LVAVLVLLAPLVVVLVLVVVLASAVRGPHIRAVAAVAQQTAVNHLTAHLQ
jgi:hypothetical protein